MKSSHKARAIAVAVALGGIIVVGAETLTAHARPSREAHVRAAALMAVSRAQAISVSVAAQKRRREPDRR